MSTFDDLMPVDIHAPVLDEEALERARRTVASYANDAADCADLLVMLGLTPAGNGALCTKCGQSMSRLPGLGYQAGRGAGGVCSACREKAAYAAAQGRCQHGHPVPVGLRGCPTCLDYAPIEDLRLVVERVRAATGWSRNRVAREVELPISSLGSLSPSSTNKWVRRSTYTAVLRLAQELSA